MDCGNDCENKGTEACKICESGDMFVQISPLEAYERGKRDGALLLKQKVLHAMRVDINKLLDEIPKGWL